MKYYMAKIGIVAGLEATEPLGKVIDDMGEFSVDYKRETLKEVIDDLINSGIQLQALKSIMILDYAFSDEGGNLEQTVAEQFVDIQDLMQSNMLKTKLYLVTRNSDLYDKLKGNIKGISGTHYHNVQIMMIKSVEYPMDTLRSVLLGEWDNKYLFNEEDQKNKNMEQRLREDADTEVNRRKNLSDDILEMDKNTPTTEYSDEDYIDSPRSLSMKKDEERKERERIKKEGKGKNKQKQLPEKEVKESKEVDKEADTETETDLVVNVQQGSVTGTKTKKKEEEQESSLDDLKEVFENMSNQNNVTGNKLNTDEGVISVVGSPNVGVSGLVANLADMYTISQRKVLIIDLDIRNRMQTIYYKQYDENAKSQKGSNRSLIDALQGYKIEDSAVEITKSLSILSISQEEEVEEDLVYALSGGLDALLVDAREVYDIVILDVPYDYFNVYLHSMDEVDRNIFLVENKFYEIGNYIEHTLDPLLMENETEMVNIISKSSIILNKFVRGRHDLDGNEIDRNYLRKVLDEAVYPYDRIGVAGEIPFYEDWEDQYFKGIRYVWLDKLALGVYRKVFDKVVI